MNRQLFFALFVLLLNLISCSGEKAASEATPARPAAAPPPGTQQAQTLIAGSAELGEYRFTNAGFTTPTAGASMSEPVRQSVRELAAAGWLAVDGAGDVALNEKSRGDKRFLLRANGLLDIVPLAKKEMGTVQAVRALPDGSVAVDFAWRWLPNDVGTAFRTGAIHDRFATEQEGTATLMWDGSSWIILKIE